MIEAKDVTKGLHRSPKRGSQIKWPKFQPYPRYLHPHPRPNLRLVPLVPVLKALADLAPWPRKDLAPHKRLVLSDLRPHLVEVLQRSAQNLCSVVRLDLAELNRHLVGLHRLLVGRKALLGNHSRHQALEDSLRKIFLLFFYSNSFSNE